MNRLKDRHAVVQPSDISIRLIALTKGQEAIVDADAYDWLMQWPWFADWDRHTKSYRAKRNITLPTGKQKRVYMHRELLGVTGARLLVDHVNHNTLDNRKANLRRATFHQNSCNRRRRSDNKSGFKGVFFDKKNTTSKKWVAKTGRTTIGWYGSPEEAYAAYCEVAKRLYGEFFHA